MADLIAANKDDTRPVIDTIVAHLAIQQRNEVRPLLPYTLHPSPLETPRETPPSPSMSGVRC